MADTVERIGRVRPTLVEDGRGWWSLRGVCDALRCADYRAASSLVPPGHKRRWKDSPRDWKRRKAWCLIDRQGVERLVIRYCHDAPRWAVMSTLDAGAKESLDLQGQSAARHRSVRAMLRADAQKNRSTPL